MAMLKIYEFNSDVDPLVALSATHKQALYLRHYLADIGAQKVVEEAEYVDRDYMAEFAAFYAVSNSDYSNRCRRYHFFSADIDRQHLRNAAAGHDPRELNENYLGFIVIRPIPSAPLGRTVLRSYPDQRPGNPRIVSSCRNYTCHLAGFRLSVDGLAWQQQDTAVAACATIALWTMLHSSPLDEDHTIPTTADITRFAHRTASLGNRVFPSEGLTIHQILEAIKESGRAPVCLQGDAKTSGGRLAFTRERFSSVCASMIRSGYPVLIIGEVEGGRHAVCAVGFRESAPGVPPDETVRIQDADIEYLYVHDDNIGPNVRYRVCANSLGEVYLKTLDQSSRRHALDIQKYTSSCYSSITPEWIVIAVHENLRTNPDRLHVRAIRSAESIIRSLKRYIDLGAVKGRPIGLTVGTRFIKLYHYLEEEIVRLVSPSHLARVRLLLTEGVAMSLRLGVIRVGYGNKPLMDVLFDTTDSGGNSRAFCNVQFDCNFGVLVDALSKELDFGLTIRAF